MPNEPTDTELQTRRDAGVSQGDIPIGRAARPVPAPPPAYRDPYAAPGMRGSVAGFYILLAILGLALIGVGGVYLTRQRALQQNADVGVAAPEQAPPTPDASAGPSGGPPSPVPSPEASSPPAQAAPATSSTPGPTSSKPPVNEYPVPPAPTLTPITTPDAPSDSPAPPAPTPDAPAPPASVLPAPPPPVVSPADGGVNTPNGVTVNGATSNPGTVSPPDAGSVAPSAGGTSGPGTGGSGGTSGATPVSPGTPP